VMNNSASNNCDDIFNCKTKSLPRNFAEDVLNYEMELESEYVEIKTINILLELYAVNYSSKDYINPASVLVYPGLLNFFDGRLVLNTTSQ
jgi:hypothetical protein